MRRLPGGGRRRGGRGRRGGGGGGRGGGAGGEVVGGGGDGYGGRGRAGGGAVQLEGDALGRGAGFDRVARTRADLGPRVVVHRGQGLDLRLLRRRVEVTDEQRRGRGLPEQLDHLLRLLQPLGVVVAGQVGVREPQVGAADLDVGHRETELLPGRVLRQQRVAEVLDRLLRQDRGPVLPPRLARVHRRQVEVRGIRVVHLEPLREPG